MFLGAGFMRAVDKVYLGRPRLDTACVLKRGKSGLESV